MLMIECFKNLSEAWQTAIFGAAVAVALAFIGALAAFLKWIFRKKGQSESSKVLQTTTKGPESPVQTASGSVITQNPEIDRSHREGAGINIERIEPGAILVINYVDGLPDTPLPDVKKRFEKGREHYNKHEYKNAVHQFTLCLDIENDPEKRGALNLQIGNCYYQMRRYIKASEFYSAGLREARKANDRQGQASNLASLANTYLQRPASTGLARGENVRQAVQHYESALLIFKKDEYPVQYATTQNNLGNAYTYLPSATPQQRAENVRNAIECYKAALQIRKKDEYPQDYCSTAANMGLILADIDDRKNACFWLKESYSLRQFLPDQGKRIEDIMNRVCSQE